MIKDTLECSNLYYGLSKNLKDGFEWLKTQDLENIESKKYIIDGERLYANVQEYETKTDAKYEAHKKYIDIQYLIKGRERIGICDLKNCKTCINYDPDADIEFFECMKNEDWINLNQGEFAVLFPSDAHKPSIKPCEINGSIKNLVKKVVVKVRID